MLKSLFTNPGCKIVCLAVAVLLQLGAVQPLSAGSIFYAHDAAGRLTGMSSTNGSALSYAYDPAGNLLRRTRGAQGSVVGNEDSDHDGLPDAWELQYFHTLSRDGTGDYDHDGFSDNAEFLLGTDPTNPESLLRIIPPPLMNANGVTVTWTTVPGKTYRLQYRTALDDGWYNVPGDVPASSATASKLDSGALLGSRQRFYRVLLVADGSQNTVRQAPQLFSNPAIDSTGLTVQWSAVSGETYRLQFKDSLNDPAWQDVPGDVTADGDIASKKDTTAGGSMHRFYRVLLIGP